MLNGGLVLHFIYTRENQGTVTMATTCYAYAGTERLDGDGNVSGSKIANKDIKPRIKLSIIVDEVGG